MLSARENTVAGYTVRGYTARGYTARGYTARGYTNCPEDIYIDNCSYLHTAIAVNSVNPSLTALHKAVLSAHIVSPLLQFSTLTPAINVSINIKTYKH